MKQHEAKNLEAHELRRVAVLAECDPRTVRRFVSGKKVVALVRQRIERALRQLAEGAR